MEAKYSYLSEIQRTGNQLQTQCHKLSSSNYFIYAQIYFPCIKGDLWSLFHALDIVQNCRRKISQLSYQMQEETCIVQLKC